ncbi:MAG: aldo/keto reductase [Hyphomicrobiales bacterium]|nr:aldo/keto reductase [Hyphomicrobiales bacterium]
MRLAAGNLCAAALIGRASAQRQEKPTGEDKMQRRKIPSSGEELPLIGLGTWQGFDVGESAEERAPLAAVLSTLFESGGSVIDSSPMYGAAEGVTGDLLAQMKTPREKPFIATKVWTRGRDAGIAQMRQSMKLLRVSRLDLMQVHNLVDWRVHLATLREWKREKRIRYLGVSHYESSAYGELESIMRSEKLDFVQLNYALDDRAAEERLLPLAAERGIAVLVNRPFGGGGLLQRLRGRPLPSFAGEIGCTSWGQFLLKYVLGNPAVTCVIPGTGKPEHMHENAAAGFGSFPDAAMRARMVASMEA